MRVLKGGVKYLNGSLVKWAGAFGNLEQVTRKRQGFQLGDTLLVVSQSVTELGVLHKGQHRWLHIMEVEEL